jgi:electron transport complex protein RnfG
MANPVHNPVTSKTDTRRGKQLLTLAVVIVVCLSILALARQLTAVRIARNERAWFEAQINALVPTDLHDNDLLTDRIEVIAPDALGTRNPVAVYRARLNGTPTAAIINSVAPDGYGGPIELLVAVSYDGKVLGVRVLAHHETPGMGDAFAQTGSNWLAAFIGRSLTNPEMRGWNVRKDGGQFEQFTSATISPRAIIQSVQRTLDYHDQHRDALYRQATANP